jgi:predicted SnoaL-like aldol condensation-catalyzing enzyme
METPIAADTAAARAAAEVVTGFFAEVLSGPRDTAALDRFVAEDFVDHDPAGDDHGIAGVATKLAGLWTALPDGAYALDRVVAAGESVVAFSRLTPGDVAFADLYRVRDGRIREHWHVVDTAALGAALAG